MKMRIRNDSEIKSCDEIKEKFENWNDFIWEVRYFLHFVTIHSLKDWLKIEPEYGSAFWY